MGNAAPPPPASTITQIPPNDTAVAVYIRPAKTFDDNLLGLIPWERLPWPPLVINCGELGVEEVVFFASQLDPDRRISGMGRLDFAAAARLREPLKRQELAKRFGGEIVQRNGHAIVKLPAGAFLHSKKIVGELRFTNRDGKASSDGIHIGRFDERRGYLEGGSKSSAIFSFSLIPQRDMPDDRLVLNLNADVFPTFRMPTEFARAKLALRNPETGIASEPIVFDADSYSAKQLVFPRRLRSADGKTIDLIDDLVAEHQIEAVLTGEPEAVYFGVSRNSLSIRPPASEYAQLDGKRLIVAPSIDKLESILQQSAKPSSFGSELSAVAHDAAVILKSNNPTQQRLCEQFAIAFESQHRLPVFAPQLSEASFVLDLSEPRPFIMKAKFANAQSAFDEERDLREFIDSWKKVCETSLWQARGDAGGALVSYVFQGVALRFPKTSAGDDLAELVRANLDDAFSGIALKANGARLQLSISKPKLISRPLSADQHLALAWLDHTYASHLDEFEHFEACAARWERVTKRRPDLTALWFRRAHQLAYNTSAHFDAYTSKYAWVRRGIFALLDRADRSPESIDMQWMTAWFLANKIGTADERVHYRQLFAADAELHERLAKHISLEEATGEDGVDNWLAARLLFDRCKTQLQSGDAQTQLPQILVYSAPAKTTAMYAAALDEQGRFAQAKAAWKLAASEFNSLGQETIPWGEPETVSLRPDLKTLSNAQKKANRQARKWIGFDTWIARCELEQADGLRQCREFVALAEKQRNEGNRPGALEYDEKALEALYPEFEAHPDQVAAIADSLRKIVQRYDKAAKESNHSPSERAQGVLILIKQAPELQFFPLMDELGQVGDDAIRAWVSP